MMGQELIDMTTGGDGPTVQGSFINVLLEELRHHKRTFPGKAIEIHSSEHPKPFAILIDLVMVDKQAEVIFCKAAEKRKRPGAEAAKSLHVFPISTIKKIVFPV